LDQVISDREGEQWRLPCQQRGKLPFVHGTLSKPIDGPIKGDQWEACNNLVIAWVMN